MVSTFAFATLLPLATLAAHSQAGYASTVANRLEIIAYVFPRDRVLLPNEVAAKKLTRINYAFANVADGKVLEGFAHDKENFAILKGLKQYNPNLKILVSVGGWTWSKNFSDVALTKKSRKIFIDSAVDFVTQYDLDGLDIDWEYPGLNGLKIKRITLSFSKNYASASTAKAPASIAISIRPSPPEAVRTSLNIPRWPRYSSMSTRST
jgi:chitinase